MTKLFEAKFVCAICGHESETLALGSTNSFGAPDLDMRPPGMIRDTLGLEIHSCPMCNYVSTDISKRVSKKVKKYVLSPEYQKRAAKNVPFKYTEIKRYIDMSYILLYEKRYFEGFTAIMKAAWVADDMYDFDCAIKLRKKALRVLENTRAKYHFNRDTRTLITADLYRRTGDFDKVIDLCSDYCTKDPLIADSLKYEIELATEKDTDCHSIRYNPGENNDNTCSNSDTRGNDMTETDEQPIISTGEKHGN